MKGIDMGDAGGAMLQLQYNQIHGQEFLTQFSQRFYHGAEEDLQQIGNATSNQRYYGFKYGQ